MTQDDFRRKLLWLSGWVLAVACAPLHAQQAEVAIQRSPYYVSEPVLVRVTVEGFEETPQPDCEPQAVSDGLTVKLLGVAPIRTSSVIRSINGKTTRSSSVTLQYDYHITASKPGTYAIKNFKVSQGATQANTQGLRATFEEIEQDDNARITLSLPPGPLYPGQRTPVTMEFWYARELDELASLSIRAPLFERFTFVDEPIKQGDATVPVIVGMEVLRLKATVEKRTLDGKKFSVISVRRTMIPDKPGTHLIDPISVVMDVATRWARDPFGGRRPANTKKARAVGKPISLEVKSLPLNEAPPGFAGAVGQEFTLEVAADRTVVRVGDPIQLTLTLKGEGNLESAGLASLGYEGGLDSSQFRSPATDATGELNEAGTSKKFIVSVRVLNETVTQIPPITYAWFDPQRSAYQTSQSSPIALKVLSAKTIGAEDVISTTETPNAVEAPREEGEQTKPARSNNDLTGADLTNVSDHTRLLKNKKQSVSVWAQPALYSGSILLVLIAWQRRKVADVDPALLERRKLLNEQLSSIRSANSLSRQEAAQQISNACRKLTQYAQSSQRSEIDAVISACDTLTFAPADGNTDRIDAQLHARAVEIVERIAKEST